MLPDIGQVEGLCNTGPVFGVLGQQETHEVFEAAAVGFWQGVVLSCCNLAVDACRATDASGGALRGQCVSMQLLPVEYQAGPEVQPTESSLGAIPANKMQWCGPCRTVLAVTSGHRNSAVCSCSDVQQCSRLTANVGSLKGPLQAHNLVQDAAQCPDISLLAVALAITHLR